MNSAALPWTHLYLEDRSISQSLSIVVNNGSSLIHVTRPFPMGVLIESESSFSKGRPILSMLDHEDLPIVLFHKPRDLNLNLLYLGQPLSLTVECLIKIVAHAHSIKHCPLRSLILLQVQTLHQHLPIKFLLMMG